MSNETAPPIRCAFCGNMLRYHQAEDVTWYACEACTIRTPEAKGVAEAHRLAMAHMETIGHSSLVKESPTARMGGVLVEAIENAHGVLDAADSVIRGIKGGEYAGRPAPATAASDGLLQNMVDLNIMLVHAREMLEEVKECL